MLREASLSQGGGDASRGVEAALESEGSFLFDGFLEGSHLHDEFEDVVVLQQSIEHLLGDQGFSLHREEPMGDPLFNPGESLGESFSPGRGVGAGEPVDWPSLALGL